MPSGTATEVWWREWWGKSNVELGTANVLLQRWYYTMLYLLRGAARVDAVAPALWGPWSVSDAPDWGDEMTLDYNFEASFSFDVGFMRERGCNID